MSDRCKYCAYGFPVSCGWACDYIGYTGHMRGCDGGDKCTKFVSGRDGKPKKGIEIASSRKKIDEAMALRLYKQHLNDAEMGRAMGVASSSVANWRKRRGLPPNHCTGTETTIDYNKVAELYGQGMYDPEIAKLVGCSKEMIYKWRKRKGLVSNWRKKTG